MPALQGVRCRDVTKMYDGRVALLSFTKTFQAGQITAIVGHNGAGKSTLVGLLAGNIRPSREKYKICFVGAGDVEQPLERRRIGLVAHSTLLYGDLTARENLQFYAKLYGCGDAEVERAISRVGLSSGYLDRLARTYSRGMAQRTAIARAILHDPDLLLCDEPYTGLDPQGADLLSEILTTARSAGKIVLFVTHDLEVAARLADRALILRGGREKDDLTAPLSAEELKQRLTVVGAG